MIDFIILVPTRYCCNAGMLEDNLNHTGAEALRDVVVRLGGWPWSYGRWVGSKWLILL